MRKLGFAMVHYAEPYFEAVLKAIYPQVDKIVILYTDTPSQGWPASIPCPDTEAELKAIATACDPDKKIHWHKGNWSDEGSHCWTINEYRQGYDWLVRFDSDEIFAPGSVDYWIKQAEQTKAEVFRAPFLHFWRSFSKVCRDGQMPDRLFRGSGGEGFFYLDDGTMDGEREKYRVYHMGYAQPTKYIDYKLQVQGHHSEFRPDWLETKWLPNAQVDVHPVIFDFWATEDYDPTLMPPELKSHKYYGQEIIE